MSRANDQEKAVTGSRWVEMVGKFSLITVGLNDQVSVAPRGNSHMKQTGMLVVLLRGVNIGFWSRLGCSGQSANVLSRQGLV